MTTLSIRYFCLRKINEFAKNIIELSEIFNDPRITGQEFIYSTATLRHSNCFAW